jgi:hypothetical protein
MNTIRYAVLGLVSVSLASLALQAFGQGALFPDGSSANGDIEIYSNTSGALGAGGYSYYGLDTAYGGLGVGDMGFEIWYMNGTNQDLSLINGLDAVGDPTDAYAALSGSTNFTLAAAYYQVPTSATIGSLGSSLNLADVNPAGGPITVIIAAWTGDGTSFGSTGAGNAGGFDGYGGVVAFYLPTVDYTRGPPPIPNDLGGRDSDGSITQINGADAGFNDNMLYLSPITGTFGQGQATGARGQWLSEKAAIRSSRWSRPTDYSTRRTRCPRTLRIRDQIPSWQ